MPYSGISDLPPNVKKLSSEKQKVWLRVFNESFDKGEEKAFASAWTAVNNVRKSVLGRIDEIMKGGKGSGNFGHKGRIGQVGGSGKKGDIVRDTGKAGVGDFMQSTVNISHLMDDGVRKKMENFANDVARWGRDNGNIENAMIIRSDTGNDEVGRTKGTKSYVEFPDGSNANNVLHGAKGKHIMIHNHPSSNSFSEQDVFLFLTRKGVEHMVAVDADGKGYFLLSKTKDYYKGMYDDDVVKVVTAYKIAHKKNHVQVGINAYEKMINEGRTEDEANKFASLSHSLADMKVLKKYGIEYHRITRSDV